MNFEKGFLLGILFSVILFGFSFSQDAAAIGGTISDGVSCTALGFTWILPNTCKMNSNITISSSETLTVGPGVVLEINSNTINNFGKIVNQHTIENGFFGRINSPGVIENQRQIVNFGTINGFGTIDNRGILINFGTLSIFGIFNNYATFDNSGTTFNTGIIMNDDVVDNSDTIENSGIIENFWEIDNSGIIENLCGGEIIQDDTFTGDPVDEFLCSPILNSPLGGSTEFTSTPSFSWSDDPDETRLITQYTWKINPTSDPNGIPIEITSLSLQSHTPIALGNNDYVWTVSATGINELLLDYPLTIVPEFATPFVLTINGNTPPIAVDDSYIVDEDITLTVDATNGVLFNDTDAEGDILVATLTSGTTNGALTLNLDGSFEYIPNPDFFGTDSFTYVVNDGQENSNIATVNITILSVNDAPIISVDLIPVCGEEDEGCFTVLFDVTDVDSVPTVSANINGGIVTNEQKVILEIDDETEFEYKDGILKIEDLQFALTVIATDDGMDFTRIATPSFDNFVEECDDDKDHDDDKEREKHDDDKDHDDDKEREKHDDDKDE